MRAQTVFQRMRDRFEQGSIPSQESMDGARRLSHGGSAWSLPRGLNLLRQPQDGAAPVKSGSSNLLAALKTQTNLFEPEDADITGGTRSLSRRLMGLNVTEAPRKPIAASARLPRRQAA